MSQPLIVDYYTDILCVWAWIAQRRIEELNKTLSEKIDLRFHYVDVFGDVATKMAGQWGARGGYEGFAEHVKASAAAFDDAPVHPAIWSQDRPATSANAHLVLKAIQLAVGCSASVASALLLRKEFFVNAKNIADLTVLAQIVAEQGLDWNAVQSKLDDGSAMAALMGDYQKAKQQGIHGSPSYVLDGGRQVLYGNVGYRVILANIEQLLKNPTDEASWC